MVLTFKHDETKHGMAAKDEGFNLNKRQKAKYERLDQQEDTALQENLAVVKKIEKEWNIFKQ